MSLDRIGNYDLEGFLAFGETGPVYRGRDQRLNRPVAIKILDPRFARDAQLVERVKAEAVIQAKLSHPNIVAVLDFIASDEHLALVMELVDGAPLSELIERRGGPLPLDLVLSTTDQVLSAMEFAHSKGLVHRDLKPSNILVQQSGEQPLAKVAGFGRAKLLGGDRMPVTSTVKMDTVVYMSPERLHHPRALDHRSDLYSLGVVLYVSLTGRRPLAGSGAGNLLQFVQRDVPRPSLAVESIPKHLDAAVLRATARDPRDRFQDAAQFRAALRGQVTVADVGATVELAASELDSQALDASEARLVIAVPPAREALAPPLVLAPSTGPAPQPPLQEIRATAPLAFEPCDPQPLSWRRVGLAGAVLFVVGLMAGLGIVLWTDLRSPPPPPAQAEEKQHAPNEEGKRPAGTEIGVGSSAPQAVPQPTRAATREPTRVAPPREGEVRTNPRDGLEYVWIPAGTFEQGCAPADAECEPDERPRHRVGLERGFRLGKVEVTVAAYGRYARASRTAMPEAPPFNPDWGARNHPIVNVTWYDATAFCTWAGGRLPTEAQWERAARGGHHGLTYTWGHLPSREQANYRGIGGRDRWEQTSPVGSFPSNGFGLHDMNGNVWEWCRDWYAPDYYQASLTTDPSGPSSGEHRVVRGGSWLNVERYLRASYRLSYGPETLLASVGFRCAQDTEP